MISTMGLVMLGLAVAVLLLLWLFYAMFMKAKEKQVMKKAKKEGTAYWTKQHRR